MSSDHPRFSVLTPVYNPAPEVLRATIASVLDQTFPSWELILVDDCSTDPVVRDVLSEAAASDVRIRVISRTENGGITVASQDALNAATGAYCALLDHDDALAPIALQRMAEAIDADATVDYLYSDEDKIDESGHRFDPFAKPDWSPERLLGQMYTSHLSVLRTSLVRSVGGFRPGYDGSQDHDLVLRVTHEARTVAHVPEILYHWRSVPGSAAAEPGAKAYAWEAGRHAVDDQLKRAGIVGSAEFGPQPGTYRIRRVLDPAVRVSVIIPTRGGSGQVWGERRCFVVEAVRSLLAHTDHDNVEIVAVVDTETPPEVIDQLREIAGDQLVLAPFLGAFNFSRKCNEGYLAATGDVLLFLNDDTEVISDRWLETLVAPLADPSVGMTGAKLRFEDGAIQHGGHVYDSFMYTHAFIGADPDSTVGFCALQINRECSGVTAACAAMTRDAFDDVGGFCEDLPGNFNDVDLCFKITRSGRRILFMADCELYHFESRSREPSVQDWEVRRVVGRNGLLAVDPYLPSRYTRTAAAKVRGRLRRLKWRTGV